MSSKPLIAIAGAALLIGGCASGQRSSASPDAMFGESVKWNAAVQVIDPDPVYTEADAKPGSSGAKGAEAVKRYRTDNVKEVRVLTTTSNSSSGSSDPR